MPSLAASAASRPPPPPPTHTHRFESACNQLGLDNAKPKSILKLMDVDGLTKANIKSHLQKYRCMMNKRSAEAGDGEARPAKAPRVQRRADAAPPLPPLVHDALT